MSLLEQQFQQLILKKRKVALLRTFLELAVPPNSNGTKEELDADSEVVADLKGFIQDQIERIESGKESVDLSDEEVGPHGSFTLEEVETLKALCVRAMQREAVTVPARAQQVASGAYAEDDEAPAAPIPRRGPKPPQPATKVGNKDMLIFAQENRHMSGKRVIVHTAKGKVGGTVVGAISPNLIVQTDSGHQVPVSPADITLE